MDAHRSKLWIPAAIVWIAWLAGLGLMWSYYRLHVMHPHFVWLVGLLAIQCAAAIVLVVWSLARIVRGPGRRGAAGWLLLGTAPLWLWAAHFGYGAWRMNEEHAPMTVPVKMIGTAVGSFADMFARARHRQRAASRHTLLFHDAAEMPQAQLDEIDRHVERMDKLLGRAPQGNIHWIRGEVFGAGAEPGGWSVRGLAIVTHPAAGVQDIDRHEVAHAVIERHAGPLAVPPTVLIEGWAESQSGYRPGLLAYRAQRRRGRGQVLSLRELTGRRYARGDWPVYEFGGALVEYLLDEYGGPKFLELYSTCRPETFGEDCRRVLGVDVDTLERQYWEFVDKRVRESAADLINPLLDVPLADGVDRDAWNAFARQYPDARRALAESLEHVSLDFRGTFASNDAEPKPIRVSITNDGPNRRLRVEGIDEHYVRVATPDRSFFARRRDGGQPWTLDLEYHRGDPFVEYCALRDSIDREADEFTVGGPEDIFKCRFVDAIDRDDFRVTRFERSDDGGEPVARLECEFTSGDTRHEESFVLLPARHWAMRECEASMTGKDFTAASRSRFEYDDPQLPAGVPTAAHWSYEWSRGSIHRDVTLADCKREPEAEAFELATFALSPSDLPGRARVPWYVTLTAFAGLASLLIGTALVVGARRKPPSAPNGGV